MARSVAEAVARIEGWYTAAVAAVEPERAVARYLRRDGASLILNGQRIEIGGRLIVIAIGKAALAMARSVEAIAGDLIDAGMVLTKDGHSDGSRLGRFEVFEAAHPIPDDRGVAATKSILALVDGLGPRDVVLALISGGGSALLEAPRPPVTLDDFARATDLLLRAGAPIEDLNTVRRALSQVKAGGILRAAAPATVHTIILSDVLGNDTRVIASGPTVAGQPDPTAADDVLDRFGVRERVPPSVPQSLRTLREEPLASGWSSGIVVIVGDNESAVRAAAAAAHAEGCTVKVVPEPAAGEASTLGRAWVDRCLEAGDDVDVIVGGGEATVTVRGDGVGGRNTEFALAAAMRLANEDGRDWVVASLATDGEDGPTEVAGAIADAGTAARSRAAGTDPAAALANNDSLRVFAAAGGIVKPGPTGTNVNDLYFAVRIKPQ